MKNLKFSIFKNIAFQLLIFNMLYLVFVFIAVM